MVIYAVNKIDQEFKKEYYEIKKIMEKGWRIVFIAP